MQTFGNVTPPVIFLTSEADKLMREFDVAADIYAGQQVKLNAVGSIVPCVAGDVDAVRIGVSIHTRLAADTTQPFPYSGVERATVVMRGFMTLQAQAGAALIPGPVKFSGLSAASPVTGQKYPQYINIVGGALETDGWAMNVATAQGQVVEVVVR